MARIASSSGNTLGLSARLESWQKLANFGLADAVRHGDRGGEANCLKGLGDLAMRVSDLDAASRYYQQALPLYREIKDRLGEANCLQSLGLMALARNDPAAAFEQFVKVLSIYRTIGARLGEQATLGYLARTAATTGEMDQSLVLAGKSLEIGQAINDRFGQGITLDLIIQLLQQQQNDQALHAAIVLRHHIAQAIKDQDAIDRFQPVLEQVRQQMSTNDWSDLENGAATILNQALSEAEKRLGGRDPLTLG